MLLHPGWQARVALFLMQILICHLYLVNEIVWCSRYVEGGVSFLISFQLPCLLPLVYISSSCAFLPFRLLSCLLTQCCSHAGRLSVESSLSSVQAARWLHLTPPHVHLIAARGFFFVTAKKCLRMSVFTITFICYLGDQTMIVEWRRQFDSSQKYVGLVFVLLFRSELASAFLLF